MIACYYLKNTRVNQSQLILALLSFRLLLFTRLLLRRFLHLTLFSHVIFVTVGGRDLLRTRDQLKLPDSVLCPPEGDVFSFFGTFRHYILPLAKLAVLGHCDLQGSVDVIPLESS